MKNGRQMTFGVIVGNRGFFPDQLAKDRPRRDAEVLASGRDPHHCVNSGRVEVRRRRNPRRRRASAVICSASIAMRLMASLLHFPNFGEERGIVDAMRHSTLKVPVLVQATPDRAADMKISHRRDSFCGKMSACNNMMQYGIPYSLTELHTVQPDSDEFRKDLAWFSSVCRVVRGFTNLRVGAIGARPAAFNTVRYSEKLLERNGISVERSIFRKFWAESSGSRTTTTRVQSQAGGDQEICQQHHPSRSPR